ncbi:hypothetical protein TWF506_005765 [Arthrobotrys conoides]|uniref:DUF7918 domain-containing protein n=1 Tax=Arthrobotrys conoides TaxID=74498 RepID=A0AAN8NCM7_9PEZI
MPTLRNVTCEILIDGKPAVTILPKFQGNVCTSYIIAEERKPYSFKFKFGKTGSIAHCVWITVDGQDVNITSCAPDERNIVLSGSKYGLTTSYGRKAWEYRHLEFRGLGEIGDPNDPETCQHRIQNVGKIKIVVKRQHGGLEVIDVNPQSDPGYDMFTPLKSIPESEIQKRNITHGTEISSEVADFWDASRICLPKGLEDREHVVFNFHYASREMLRKIGVLSQQANIDDDLVGMSLDTLQQEIMSLRDQKDPERKPKSSWRWFWKRGEKAKAEEALIPEKASYRQDLLVEPPLYTSEKPVQKEKEKTSKAKKFSCF